MLHHFSVFRLAVFGSTLVDLFVLILGAILAIVLLHVIPWYMYYQGELRYVNNEIKRTEGEEQKHWKKRKRRLLLSLLPFFYYE